MTFNSFDYVLLFLPLTFILYSFGRNNIFGKIVILVASLIFYSIGSFWYVVPLLTSAAVDYLCGLKISSSTNDTTRKRWLTLSITTNLSLLCLFKYTGWFTSSLADLGIFGAISVVTVPLPPGISFYTFQTMSYTISVFRGDHKPTKNPLDFLNFVSFFPQLVAGPIERSSHLLPQLSKFRPFITADDLPQALFMILYGLFLKTAIADNLGGVTNTISTLIPSTEGSSYPGLGILFAVAFAGQIYADFSAYTLIARGTAKLFGVDLMRNFLTPYLAISPSDFWNRWHISLSSWLRDYLYIPLGGNRKGTLRTFFNLMVVMTLCGLWHGAGVMFVLWGIYHGLLLIFYRLFPIHQWLQSLLGSFGKFVSIVIMFTLVCFGWILFRATPEQFPWLINSITSLPTMLHFNELFTPAWVNKHWYFTVMLWGTFIFTIPMLIADVIGYLSNQEFPDLWHQWPAWLQTLIVLILTYAIVFFARRESNEFIYFAF